MSLSIIYVKYKKVLDKLGYAEVAYIYGKYEFVDHLCEVQKSARDSKLGIWNGNREEGYCKTKSNKTTKVSKEETTRTKKKETKDKKNSSLDELIDILEKMIDKTTCVPILIFLCVLLVVLKAIRGKNKKK